MCINYHEPRYSSWVIGINQNVMKILMKHTQNQILKKLLAFELDNDKNHAWVPFASL